MNDTPNLALPYILAAQAQKHVTHNEAIRALDCLVQLSVASRTLTEPPASPDNGSRYIVASGAGGAWADQDGKVAAYQDGAWAFYAPRTGWCAWAVSESALLVYEAGAWSALPSDGGEGGSADLPTAFDGLAHVGINATGDTTNRLSLKSPASLFDNEGAGHQQKINKKTSGDTASVLYQTNYSGRAEMGLAGDDDFHFKVSPDGSTWYEAIKIDRSSGRVSFPNLALKQFSILDHRALGWSLTGTTSETALVSVLLPGGILGPNGAVRVTTLWTGTSNANSKSMKVKHAATSGIAGNNYTSASSTTTPTSKIQTEFHNRNSVSSQVGGLSAGTGGWGATSLGLTMGTVDTSADSYINISGILANAADTLTLEAYTIEVLCQP
ncbi:DUF2793 domain-containing protein [Hyphomicrobium denitrificans]|nr:DUF2793 domain-containing protein [Hyphomicrobium denitrificans]